MRMRTGFAVATLLSLAVAAGAAAGDANRLTYLDRGCDPYYPDLQLARLATPQWIGCEGVEAAIVLSIDDLRDVPKYEAFLRPIINRLKKIDGRGPVSIMTNHVDPTDGHLQRWLDEGVSLEAHTRDHPCPCLKSGSPIAWSKETFDAAVDMMARIPGNRPVAFRMPCCDSMNSVSPRFFAEIFNKTTPGGNFLTVDSSVFTVFTAADPALPRSLVLDRNGAARFQKYLPKDRLFSWLEDYPYPYVVGRLCWEIPAATPDDWQGQNLRGVRSPATLADVKAAIDATVLKQGVYTLVFHPHGWIGGEQVVELIDYVTARYGGRVKFVTLGEVDRLLTENLLGGQPLRAADGRDGGVRVLDLNADGFMDVVVGNRHVRQTRVWSPETGRWIVSGFPAEIASVDRQGNRRDAGARFGVLQENGNASVLVRNETAAGLWHFDGEKWIEQRGGLTGLDLNGPIFTAAEGRDSGTRLLDVDRSGACELIVGNQRQNGVFQWSIVTGRWNRLPFSLPGGTAIVDAQGRDAGLRFVDPNVDGHPDVVFSNAGRYAVHLFTSIREGWSRTMIDGRRGEQSDPGKRAIPEIVRSDGTDNGAWFKFNHMWVQNEQTGGRLPGHLDRRHFTELLGTCREPPARSPEDSLHSIEVKAGFRVELVAAEPMVLDPADMAWGPDGKLWIVEFADYPLGRDNKNIPCGRIRYLEDTDDNGRYDKSTVFIEPVSCPMGVMPWRKGVIVTAAPDVFYAEDTDGDGRADVRKTLFTGFGVGNHQHRVNHPRWGLDNWVHCANGDSNGNVKSLLTGQVVNISGRDLRLKPDEGLLDPQSGRTQFGTNRDDWGNWFGCNNPNPGWFFALADHYIRRNPHVAPPPVRVDVTSDRTAFPVGRVISHCDLKHRPHAAWGRPGRWTSVAGVTIYRDDLFGPDYTGNLFVNDSVFNVIHRRVLRREGTVFRGDRGPDEADREFLASHDVWFRPSTQETGPDGALWILDFHRFVIEHPEWIDDELEKTLDLRAGADRGRIFRVYPVDKRPRKIPRLDRLDTAGLVAALDHPNGWQRDMAHQMILWRADASAREPLEKMVLSCDRATARLHAICALDGLGLLRAEIVARALADKHPGVRRHAIRVTEPLLAADGELGEALLTLENDPDPHVQMQLAYTLGYWHDVRAGRALGRMAVRHADDVYLTAAVMSSAVRHTGPMIAEVMADRDRLTRRSKLIADLLNVTVATDDQTALATMLALVAERPKTGFDRWQFFAMRQLLDGASRRGTDLTRLIGAADDSADRRRGRVLELFEAARALADDAAAPVVDRTAAIGILGRGLDDHDDDVRLLRDLLIPQVPAEVQLAAVECLGRLHRADVPELLLDDWFERSPRLHNAILDVLLARKQWVAALFDRLEDRPEMIPTLGTTRRELLLRHPDSAVGQRAEKLLGKATTSDEIAQRLEKYAAVLDLTGNVERGKKIFTEATCADCHKLQDIGNEISTDLTTLVDKSPGALLVALVDPNRAVEDKYIQYQALTTDGLMHAGMLFEETGNSITLADVAGKKHVILRRDLDEFVSTGRSHMPEGLEQKLTVQQVADLFAFIAPADGANERLVTAEPDGSLQLGADACRVFGREIRLNGTDFLVWFFHSLDERVIWAVDVPVAGDYQLWIRWAQIDEYANNPIAIEALQGTEAPADSGRLETTLPSTGGWGSVRERKFGTLTLTAGRQRVVLRPNGPAKKELSDIYHLRLVPVAP